MGGTSTQSTLQLQVASKGSLHLGVVEVAGEVWFHAPSLVAALQSKEPDDFLHKIPDDEKRVDKLRTGGVVQQALFVTEAGFYRAIFLADAAIAEPLKQWVTQKVLPAIRKTGHYRLHQEAQRLGVTLELNHAQWEWLKLHPDMYDLLPLAAAGFNSVEITRALNYTTPSGITARKRIERLKELKFLPNTIEPRSKRLERQIMDSENMPKIKMDAVEESLTPRPTTKRVRKKATTLDPEYDYRISTQSPNWLSSSGASLATLHEHGRLWVFDRLPARGANELPVLVATARKGDASIDMVRGWWHSLELGPAADGELLFLQLKATLQRWERVVLVVQNAHLLEGRSLEKLRLPTEWKETQATVVLVGNVSAIDMATREFPSFYQRALYCIEVQSAFA